MKIFIAYSNSPLELEIALKIGQGLRAKGHNVIVGDSDDLAPTILWTSTSFRNDWVGEHIKRSDVFIGVCLSTWWTNVGSEIGFFLAGAKRNRLIILKYDETNIPSYLESPRVIIYDDQINGMLSSIESAVEQIERELTKTLSQIFLSYSREDEIVAKNIYEHLKRDGFRIWFDKSALRPGQDWNLEITKAIQNSLAIVILLSSRSVTKRGYFQREIKRSLEVAEEIPEGEIFILPVKLDDCEIPEALKRYQWCQYQGEDSYTQLSGALERLLADREKRIGDTNPE